MYALCNFKTVWIVFKQIVFWCLSELKWFSSQWIFKKTNGVGTSCSLVFKIGTFSSESNRQVNKKIYQNMYSFKNVNYIFYFVDAYIKIVHLNFYKNI